MSKYQQALIYFMSGTGNTYRAATWAGEEFNNQNTKMQIIPFDRANPTTEIIQGEKSLLGLFLPTHGFTAPWVMIRFALSLPAGEGTHAFISVTRGGTKFGNIYMPGFEGTAAYLLALILKIKGYKIRGVIGLDMPLNWTALVPGFSNKTAEKMNTRMKPKITAFINTILNGEKNFGFWTVFSLILIAVAVRIFIFWLMHPGIHTDSVTFFFLNELDMVRTPGYPIFIEFLLSINDLIPITTDYISLICFGQLFFLGVLNSLLLYRIAYLLTRKRIFSLFMGIFYNFNYFIIGFEFQLLTETLSITLLFSVIVLYLQFFKGKKLLALFAGIFMVLLIYTKPTFLLLGIFLPTLTFFGFYPKEKKVSFLKKLTPLWILFIAVNIIGAGGWALRNKIKFDYF